MLLAGCKPVGPNYTRPGYQAPAAYKETGASAAVVPPPNPAGGGWQPATPSDGMLRGKWWEIYQDPQLNQLEDRIADNNQSLRQALETYLAARDQVSAVARQSLSHSLRQCLDEPRPRLRQSALGRPKAAPPLPATSRSAERQVGSRTSGAAFAAASKQRAKTRRPARPTWPTWT